MQFSHFFVLIFILLTTWTMFYYVANKPKSMNSAIYDINYINRSSISRLRYPSFYVTDQVDDWHEVTSDIVVYSAYWESRSTESLSVRVIGGAHNAEIVWKRVKCLLPTGTDNFPFYETNATSEVIPEHHNKISKAVYIFCKPRSTEIPSKVSIVPITWNESSSYMPKWITVRNRKVPEAPSHAFGVCVKPFCNYFNTFQIAEFVAFYEALGVTHFNFYNSDSSNDVSLLIQHLVMANYSVEFLPWSKFRTVEEMIINGQIANIQECIYRNLYRLSYIILVDMDEFIVPRHVMTLNEMFEDDQYNERGILNLPGNDQSLSPLKKSDSNKQKSREKTLKPPETFASFVCKTSVFCLEYPKYPLPLDIPPFETQSRIRRESYTYPFRDRSKYIIKPQLIKTGGVHFTWKFIPGWKEKLVDTNVALVHHYRKDLCLSRTGHLEKGEIDPNARKYLTKMTDSRAIAVWRNLFSTSKRSLA